MMQIDKIKIIDVGSELELNDEILIFILSCFFGNETVAEIIKSIFTKNYCIIENEFCSVKISDISIKCENINGIILTLKCHTTSLITDWLITFNIDDGEEKE